MSLVIDSYGGSGGVGDVIAIVDRDGERAQSIDGPWHQAWMRSMRVGSAGVVVLVSGYGPYQPHVGTSPAVFDSRGVVRSSTAPAPEAPSEGRRTNTRQAVLRMSSADQAREAMAALNLNKTQLADVLGVSRPTLYDWLDGKEPNVANAQRLTRLVQLLVNAGLTAADSISPRFVRESLDDDEPSLLELLKADTLDEVRVAKVLAQAKGLEADAEGMRVAREDRLRALRFEEPTAEQRKENLALNVALREWPKD
jgi:transcriptional regulator with XRE-family HTH domain